jgi:hypothetical protein
MYMLQPILNYLCDISSDVLFLNNPWRYLDRLSPIHLRFHMNPLERRNTGFLTFHWCIIFYFKALGLDKIMGTFPYSLNDFIPGGIFYSRDSDWNVWMGQPPKSRTINDLLQFSERIERWHNGAHMAMEMVTRTPIMDAAINIYYSAFWALHFFINNAFEEQLDRYRVTSGLNLVTPFQVIQQIDNTSPALIGSL